MASTSQGTVSLAHGARVYSTDATIGAHSDRLESAEAPLLECFRRTDMEARWAQRDPMTM